MKAAVLHAANQPLTIEEVALTRPGSRDVLLRTAFAGLCHSDLHFIEGSIRTRPRACSAMNWRGSSRRSATASAMSSPATMSSPASRCSAAPASNASPATPICARTPRSRLPPGVSRRLSWKGGQLMNQFLNLSSFAEQMLVHENAVVKIDPDIPLDRAALVGCGVMTGVGAVFNAAKVEPGRRWR